MLKRIITLFLLLLVSIEILSAQENGGMSSTTKCMYCKKEVDNSEIVVVSQGSELEKNAPQIKLCAKCNKLPKCGVCHAPTTNLVDELPLCKGCEHFKPIYMGKADAQKITEEVRQVLASAFKLNIKQKITVELDSSENIHQKTHSWTFAYNAGGKIVYPYPDDLPAMPRIRYCYIAAHELAHSWYSENGPFEKDNDPELDIDRNNEGFAEFVAWCYLENVKNCIPKDDISFLRIFLDEEIRMFEAHTSFVYTDNIAEATKAYGDGFRKIRKMMGKARTAPEWKKILQKNLKKEIGKVIPGETVKDGTCAYCSKRAEVESAGGDLLCRDCAKTSVKDKAEAERMMKDVRRILSTKFKMSSRHVLTYEIGTRKDLGLDSDGSPMKLGVFVSEVTRKKPEYTIRILAGLPRDVFRSIGAHELACAWMDEALPHLSDNPEVREGFAEYVAWSFSKAEGSQRMVDYIEKQTNDRYAGGFRKIKKLLNNTKTATEWKTILLREYPSPQTKKSGK